MQERALLWESMSLLQPDKMRVRCMVRINVDFFRPGNERELGSPQTGHSARLEVVPKRRSVKELRSDR